MDKKLVYEGRKDAFFDKNKDKTYDVADQARMSANLYQLLPCIPIEEHKRLINEVYQNVALAVFDQNHLQYLVSTLNPVPSDDSPKIFVTYHVGSYRVVLPYLLSVKKKIILVIDKTVNNLQGDVFSTILDEFIRHQKPGTEYIIRDTSNKALLFALAKDIKAGYSVLFFIDANKGTNERNDLTACVEVPFLDKTILVRKGVAYLSKLTKTPISPLFCVRSSNGLIIEQFSELTANPNEDKERYCIRAMSTVYQILSNYLRINVAQWECWRYVDKVIKVEGSEPLEKVELLDSDVITFNKRRFVLNKGELSVLFDRKTLKGNLISTEFVDFLTTLNEPRSVESITSNTMPKSSLESFISRGILVCTKL